MTAAADRVQSFEGPAALPRDNGELVFSAPWQARVLAMAVGLVERLGLPWDEFRLRLIQQIAQAPDRPYYESWTAALESLIVELGLTTPATLDTATPAERDVL